MRLFLIISFFLYSAVSHSQGTVINQRIKGRNYDGVIFSMEYDMNGFAGVNGMRYNPSREDIFIAECIIAKTINKSYKDIYNQGADCPVIYKNVGKYKRQYFGFVDNKGEKSLLINFIWKKNKNILKNIYNNIIIVSDGCTQFWYLKINIKNGNIYDLHINGKS